MSRFLALFGVVLLALAMLTSVRFPWLAKKLGGLAKQFRIHHWVGVIAVFFIALHVLWEFFKIPNGMRLKTLLWSSDFGLISAWLAIGLIFIAFFASYRRSLPFVVWRSVHLLFPASLLFASFHVVLFLNDNWLEQIIGYGSLVVFVGSSCALALGYVWPLGSRVFNVLSHKQIQTGTWEVMLEPLKKGAKEYRAGQVVYARFLDANFSQALHPFSVASCRFEPTLRLLIKSVGQDTSLLRSLTANSRIRLLGPFHELTPDFNSPQIWLAGGVGIAPFIGFLHCLPYQSSAPICLLHFVTRAEDALRLEDWPVLLSHRHLITLKAIVDEKKRTPDIREIDALIERLKSPKFLICGSPIFMKFMRNHLLQKGVPANQIVTEEFMP